MAFGYMFAGVAGWLFKGCVEFGQRQCWTVAIETGIQNAAISVLIVQLNFDCPTVLVEMIGVMAAYLLGQVLFMVVILTAAKVKRACSTSSIDPDDAVFEISDDKRSDQSMMLASTDTSHNTSDAFAVVYTPPRNSRLSTLKSHFLDQAHVAQLTFSSNHPITRPRAMAVSSIDARILVDAENSIPISNAQSV